MQETRRRPRDDDQPIASRAERAAPEVSPDLLDDKPAGREQRTDLGRIPGSRDERSLERPRAAPGGAIPVPVRRAPEAAAAGRPPGFGDLERAAGISDPALEGERLPTMPGEPFQ